MAILVTGATGYVGRPLTNWLLEHGEHVRVLSRKPDQADLPAPVEVVGGDLSEPSTLTDKLFAGIDKVFVFPAEGGVDALVERALSAGVSDFVVLSSLAAAKEHPRDLGSASEVHHSAVEKSVSDRTDNWTFLRPGTFANNLLSWAPAIAHEQPVRAPYLDSAQAPIHEADVAEAAGVTLTEAEHTGKAYPLTGPQALTRRQQVDAIAEAIGRPVTLEEISPEQFREEFGRWIPEGITKMLLDYWRDTVADPDVPRSVESLTGRPGRTLAQWAQDHRGAFLAS